MFSSGSPVISLILSSLSFISLRSPSANSFSWPRSTLTPQLSILARTLRRGSSILS